MAYKCTVKWLLKSNKTNLSGNKQLERHQRDVRERRESDKTQETKRKFSFLRRRSGGIICRRIVVVGRGEGPRDHDGALRIVLPAGSQSISSRAVAAPKPDLGPTAAAEPPASEPPALAAGSRQPAAPPPLLIAFARWSVHSLRVVLLHRHLVRMSVVVLRLPCRPPCQHPTTAPMKFSTELAFQL